MHQSVYDGIRFIEGRPPGKHQDLGPIEVKIGGMFQSAQLKSLDDVKRLMADTVKRKRGNAVLDFKYGQRSAGVFASLFQRDDVSWYGSGTIAVVTVPPRIGS